ncbi:cysteine desulfurase, aminotransferase class-V family [Anoxybacillus flavithermus TNO-09.006]|uniref:cysteine desulfurase n=1 Tax=Anoxybacillus flavithermus TaxID=33934 RepID=A0AAX2A2M6_9BACL|nr:cysteine desulfurase family protein [Anoxybacillus flavithermus]ELK22686.1 cysteine desulfurase, aminotransferase class-V family [Anoxybacillus flavithermus TNO-09.006]MBE2904265.1 cysteine desulfurase [Anoxybacillus flavithermus]MBE2908200.1 cysteine desulfurase [Anoxybacillus flavithermus]MBE2909593.1 cysteine desulfurase [Anoxybacillus flavithermus]MBE2916538.1 cysteine desulfurase [Anoxybacillus flavithermus]
MERIYLDYAATSPVHPQVVEAMVPYMTTYFGNPSSIHSFGRETRRALDEARETIAKTIGAKANEIIFTSGGTEADNLAIIGVAMANRERGRHIITTSVEHHAVLNTCKYLQKQGFDVTYLPVDEHGIISIEQLKSALRDDTVLVSIMFGNNETGVLQPIHDIVQLLHDHDVYFHTDAVQAYGLVPIDVHELGIDLLSVSSHKINGPKGVGFLYVREGVRLTPHIYGGEQERKRRAGTENVPGIVGLQKAAELAQQMMSEKRALYEQFQRIMLTTFEREGIHYAVNGHETNRLPHVLNVAFFGTNVEALLVNLDLAGIAASSGSACTAGSIDPSHVLVAMYGNDSERIRSSVRFSFGYGNTIEQVERAAYDIAKIVKRLTKA